MKDRIKLLSITILRMIPSPKGCGCQSRKAKLIRKIESY